MHKQMVGKEQLNHSNFVLINTFQIDKSDV